MRRGKRGEVVRDTMKSAVGRRCLDERDGGVKLHAVNEAEHVGKLEAKSGHEKRESK